MVECGSAAVAFVTRPRTRQATEGGGDVDALALYDDNGNGPITCAEARRHGIASVPRGHTAFGTCGTRTATAWSASSQTLHHAVARFPTGERTVRI